MVIKRKIIFIGGLFPNEIRAEIEKKSIGVIQYAADTLQWAILEGLHNFSNNIKVLNMLYVGSFPNRYRDAFIRRMYFSLGLHSDNVNLSFVNLPVYKLFSRYLNLKNELKSLIINDEILIIYAIHTPFIKAAVDIKKKRPNIKICLVVPDLPEFMNDKSAYLTEYLKKVEYIYLKSLIKEVDAFVLLSDYMTEPLKVGSRPWIRIEGVFNADSIVARTKSNIVKEKLKTILYTGTLAARYGIMNLLNAFTQIQDDNFRLWICGDGDARDKVQEYAKNDKRILYFGQLPREEILELQFKATVLVNPRSSEGEFTKYSFPSKTMEYLASGTPCVMNKLPAIPNEYEEFCYFCEDDTVNSLYEQLLLVCNKPVEELNQFGKNAQKFIINNKSSAVQGQKIFNMLKEL